MIINPPTEEERFNTQAVKFCGVDSYLITPKADAKWSKHNLHFRSVILDNERNVLSSGFPKFFNYEEKPECYPAPEKYQDWKIEEKKDGSLIILDYINGQFSMRTRGSFSYVTQKNHEEFQLLPAKFPKVLDFLSKNSNLSLLFEMATPSNVIVIRPKNIEFTFLNAIDKNNLKLVSQEYLLKIWRDIGCPPTPEQYSFNESRDLQRVFELIKLWKGKEGVVLSYNNNQNKLKLKSDWYLFIHRVKSKLTSTSNLLDFYLKFDNLNEVGFFEKINKEYDYEIALQLKDEIFKICNASAEANKNIDEVSVFARQIIDLESRKEKADRILNKYEDQQLRSIAFQKIDGKKIDKDQIKKLIIKNL